MGDVDLDKEVGQGRRSDPGKDQAMNDIYIYEAFMRLAKIESATRCITLSKANFGERKGGLKGSTADRSYREGRRDA